MERSILEISKNILKEEIEKLKESKVFIIDEGGSIFVENLDSERNNHV
jgi:hypothetical protein